MKYKIRYTFIALLLCGLLGWDLAYEYQKPDLIAIASTPHPVVHSIKHLIAPAYVPPTVATSTGTGTGTTSVQVEVATSTSEASTTQATQGNTPATSTNPSRRNPRARIPINDIKL